MQARILAVPESPYRLAPFLALALVLHAAVLLLIHPSAALFPSAPGKILEVYFSPAAPAASTPVRERATRREIAVPAQALEAPAAPQGIQPMQEAMPAPVNAAPGVAAQRWITSAQNIAREAARQIEQEMAAREHKLLTAPVTVLDKYLHQPHKETRLADGMLKITTGSGASICFQPVPYFARDSAGLFGIPVTCP